MATAKIIDLVGSREWKTTDGIWENYHKTGTSRLVGRYSLRSGDAGSGREDIAQAAREVREWLGKAQAKRVPVRPVGGAWSLSNIQLVQDGWMLNTRRFNRCFRLAPADFAPTRTVDAKAFLLVEGGVQVDEVLDKLQEMGRSLVTTGASNGQTFPGACATGTHGSVPTAGGIQQHVRAVQMVTPSGVWWIEPAAGLMSDEFIAATGSTPLRDDQAFAAALVAVGSLGIVTAMVIESVPLFLVRPYLKRIDFNRQDLEMLQRGDFRAFSDAKGLKGPLEFKGLKGEDDPYFTMVILRPDKPFGQAVVRFLYKFPYHPGYVRQKPAELGAGYDAQSIIVWALRNFPWARGFILHTLMRVAVGKGVTGEVYGTWGETLEASRPTSASFSAGVFCDRGTLAQTVDALCTAFSRAGGSTAVTLRFVKGGPGYGLLSPARWEHSAAIDCDGPGGPATVRAYMDMLQVLEREGIPFTLHWGKINNLNAKRVADDYGPDLARWKAVRNQLLPTPADRALFATEELQNFGLA
jgi:hypothetical protein